MSDFIHETLDGIPLRDGEKGKYFENHSLSWWRQKTAKEHIDDGEQPNDPKELTELLFDDYENHFGYPHRMSARDMDKDGILRLCFAVVKNITDDIVEAKIIELNDWHNLRGMRVSFKEMTAIRERAEHQLKREAFQIYLMGVAPDAIIREAYRVAEETVKEFYEKQEQSISAYIRKSGVTIKELVGQMRSLDIPEDEIPEWITHCTPQRMKTLKKIIKRLRKVKEEKE